MEREYFPIITTESRLKKRTRESKFYYVKLGLSLERKCAKFKSISKFYYNVHMVDSLSPVIWSSACSFTRLLFSVTLLCYTLRSLFNHAQGGNESRIFLNFLIHSERRLLNSYVFVSMLRR